MIIAVDFDGTVVDHRFPDVGSDAPGAVDTLRDLVAQGHKIILWTMRDGEQLQDAIKWYRQRNIPLFGIQRNPEQNWTTSPKAYAHLYIDDAAFGAPLIQYAMHKRPLINWETVRSVLLPKDITTTSLPH
jgi:ABC-type sugar transport system substrate-binding protein